MNSQSPTPISPPPNSLAILEAAQRALSDSGYPALRVIDVTAHQEVVLLRGHVPSYYLKQAAQTAVLSVAGIRDIHNQLVVEKEPTLA